MKATALLFCAISLASFAADPEPPIITPGEGTKPPSDAIVLFDGKDLSKWQSTEGGKEARWIVKDGAMEVNATGSVRTKEEFGDIQLHVEWAAPAEVKGDSQGRGNSGVYLQG